LFAERREQVRRGLQRAQDALAESQRREEPDQDRDGAHGPADLAVVDVEVEEQHAGKHRRRARSKREQKDVLIVRQPLLPPDHEAFKPWCCSRRKRALRDRPSSLAASLTLPPQRASARWIRCRSASSSVIRSIRAGPW